MGSYLTLAKSETVLCFFIAVNLFQIKFGITKVFRTFEVPTVIIIAGLDAQTQFRAFFVPLLKSIIDTLNGIISPTVAEMPVIVLHKAVGTVQYDTVFCFVSISRIIIKCQQIMQIQIIKVNGKDHIVGGFFNIKNALLAYSYFKQLTGREFVAEKLEGDIKAQLDIIQANNPNASPVLDVLRHAYEETKIVTDKMGYSNLFYPLSDN